MTDLEKFYFFYYLGMGAANAIHTNNPPLKRVIERQIAKHLTVDEQKGLDAFINDPEKVKTFLNQLPTLTIEKKLCDTSE